jgi:murein DD-endopeptidase MepM/ murein hydrolase activator NlpD
MAIPVYERQLNINPMPGARAADVSRPRSAPVNVGSDMAEAASRLGKAVTLKLGEYEDASALEAYNKFRREINDYHNDPEKGVYRTKLGKNSAGAADAADEWMSDKIFDYSKGMPPRAAGNFRRMAGEAREKYYAANREWEHRQFEAYRNAESDATVRMELEAIANEWGDDEAVEARKKTIYQALELKLRGLGDEAGKAAVTEVENEIAAIRFGFVAENMSADDAKAWMTAHRDEFSAEGRAKAEKFLEKAGRSRRIAGAADGFFARFGTDGRAAKEAVYRDASIPDEDRDAVWARYESFAADERRFRKEALDAVYEEWWDRIKAARSYREIAAEIQDAGLPADREKKIMAMAKQAWAGPAQDDPVVANQLYEGIMSGDITAPGDVLANADVLRPATVTRFLNLISKQALKYDDESFGGTHNDRVNQVVTHKKGPLKNKIDFREKLQVNNVFSEMVLAAREAKGGKLDDMEKMNLLETLLKKTTADEHPSKWLRYEILAAEREGFVWNDEYGDMVRISEDGEYIADVWTEREKRLSTGSDASLLDPEYWRRRGNGPPERGGPPSLPRIFTPAGGAVSSGFGATESFRKSPHRGIDIKGALGSPITAPPGEWRVISVTTGGKRSGNPDDPGNQVILAPAEGGGDRVYLSHLDSAAVSEGDIVEGGMVVGGMGNTGYTVGSSGVHLDVKVKSGGKFVDPAGYFGF